MAVMPTKSIVESLAVVASAALDRLMISGGKLVTLVVAADAEMRDVDAVTHHVEHQNLGETVVLCVGGQLLRPVTFGGE